MAKQKAQGRDVGASEPSRPIDEWIVGSHAERNRAILKRRLIDGLTYEALAEEFDLSVRQTKTIVYKSEEKLFRHLPG